MNSLIFALTPLRCDSYIHINRPIQTYFIYYLSLRILKKSDVYCLYVHLPPFKKISLIGQLAFVNDLIKNIGSIFILT